MTDLPTQVLAAAERIGPYVRVTPLDHSLALSQQTGADVYLKLENQQYTGSFKVRGALSKLLALTAEQRAAGVVTASSGNHGAGVAFGLRQLGLPGVIFVPEHAAPTKVAAIRRYGGEVRFFGVDGVDTELFARQYADERGLTFISPYNDWDVVAGQGTIGLELAQQLPELDAVFVAVGGGGLISGIAGYLKAHANKPVTVIGCQPENSAVMSASVAAGQILDMPSLPTLSDGTAGGIEPGAVTFELCRALVDQYVLVSEAEIGAAVRLAIETHHQLIEGAAGVAVAAFLKTAEQWHGKRVAIVLCGANISLEALRAVLG
jgi:threonine dehydratase